MYFSFHLWFWTYQWVQQNPSESRNDSSSSNTTTRNYFHDSCASRTQANSPHPASATFLCTSFLSTWLTRLLCLRITWPYLPDSRFQLISKRAMEKFSVSLIAFTVFWGLIGIVLPFLIPKGPNRRYALLAPPSASRTRRLRFVDLYRPCWSYHRPAVGSCT